MSTPKVRYVDDNTARVDSAIDVLRALRQGVVQVGKGTSGMLETSVNWDGAASVVSETLTDSSITASEYYADSNGEDEE